MGESVLGFSMMLAYILTKAMRVLHQHPMGAGSIYELHNLKALCVRLPAYVVVAFLYGSVPQTFVPVIFADRRKDFITTFIVLKLVFSVLLRALAWPEYTNM